MNIENSKKAIQAATDFYQSVVSGDNIRLEGIEMVGKDKKNYKITLSYQEKDQYIFGEKKRHYNTFVIDAEFNLISMGMEKNYE